VFCFVRKEKTVKSGCVLLGGVRLELGDLPLDYPAGGLGARLELDLGLRGEKEKGCWEGGRRMNKNRKIGLKERK